MRENTNIKMQLEDTKTTLSLNKEILFNFIFNTTIINSIQ